MAWRTAAAPGGGIKISCKVLVHDPRWKQEELLLFSVLRTSQRTLRLPLTLAVSLASDILLAAFGFSRYTQCRLLVWQDFFPFSLF